MINNKSHQENKTIINFYAERYGIKYYKAKIFRNSRIILGENDRSRQILRKVYERFK